MKKAGFIFAILALFLAYNCIPEVPQHPEPIPEPTISSIICGEGTHPVGDKCVSDIPQPSEKPLPTNSSAICGEGAHQVGDKCVADNPEPTPDSTEICDNLIDDDKDNLIDEGCPCIIMVDDVPSYGEWATTGIDGERVCLHTPRPGEECNGLDDNDNGQVDENCLSPIGH